MTIKWNECVFGFPFYGQCGKYKLKANSFAPVLLCITMYNKQWWSKLIQWKDIGQMRKVIFTPNEDKFECQINRKQRRIQNFPEGKGSNPKGSGVVPTYYLAKFRKNCMKMKKIGPGPSKILLCRSATGKVSLMLPNLAVWFILHVYNINNLIWNSTKR